MVTNDGFTLIELMIVVIIVALLAATGLPTYQQYTQKAAMTDLLQSMLSYKSAVELCALELGEGASTVVASDCSQGKNGIPHRYQNSDPTLGYTQSVSVAANGIITLTGQRSLAGLSVTLIPGITPLGTIQWFKRCQSDNTTLINGCRASFKFKDLS